MNYKLLLDTHTFIWFAIGAAQLSTTARKLIEDSSNEKFVSLASVWEMAIKISLNKMTVSAPLKTFVEEQLKINGFQMLPIKLDHAALIEKMIFHHKDPFDRLLIAQAQAEQMFIVSADAVFDGYGSLRKW
jgi:PIN domain nuclease of toxin-antitoxin system